jgi:hypothetical protein
MTRNRKRGQGASWAVAPAEEEEACDDVEHCSLNTNSLFIQYTVLTSHHVRQFM